MVASSHPCAATFGLYCARRFKDRANAWPSSRKVSHEHRISSDARREEDLRLITGAGCFSNDVKDPQKQGKTRKKIPLELSPDLTEGMSVERSDTNKHC
jgi:hypothetical protein